MEEKGASQVSFPPFVDVTVVANKSKVRMGIQRKPRVRVKGQGRKRAQAVAAGVAVASPVTSPVVIKVPKLEMRRGEDDCVRDRRVLSFYIILAVL